MNNCPIIQVPAFGCLLFLIIPCAAIWYFGVPSLILSVISLTSAVLSFFLAPIGHRYRDESALHYYGPMALFIIICALCIWVIIKINY
jgi:ABC-type polysaccharide/polyol phosphate export permease